MKKKKRGGDLSEKVEKKTLRGISVNSNFTFPQCFPKLPKLWPLKWDFFGEGWIKSGDSSDRSLQFA